MSDDIITYEAEIDSSDLDVHKLMHIAKSAREQAYAPYSNYKVGAGLLCDDNRMVKGYNVEVSGRNTSIHAEMMALFKAIGLPQSTRPYRGMAIATSGENNGKGPCGLCLHTMSEFVDDMPIIVEEGNGLKVFSLKDEFNNAYRPENSHERRDMDE